MKITALRATYKGKRIRLFVDEKPVCTIDLALVSDLVLYKGKSVHRGDIEHIKREQLKRGYLTKVYNYMKHRPRSTLEIKQYLQKKFYKNNRRDEIIQYIIDQLVETKWLDDYTFACWWIENRLAHRARGRMLLVQELRKKGITQKILSRALAHCYVNPKQEEHMAFELAEKKQRLLRYVGEDKAQQRLRRFLVSKGFEYQVIRKVLLRMSQQRDVIHTARSLD